MIRRNKFAAEKIKYKDGVGCHIWQVINEIHPNIGLCWDFSYKDIDEIIELLHDLKKIKAKLYK
jgi:hypothetical protein